MTSDRIIVEGMQFYGYHGSSPEERSLGQPFQVDLEAELDLLDAGSEALRCLAVLQDRSFITSRRLARHSLNEGLPGREGVAGIQYPSGFPEVRI